MDDRTVDRLFNMILIDPLEKFTRKELRKYIGGPDIEKLDQVRVNLAAQLMKQHSDNRKEHELTKPILIREGRLVLNDCSVHSFDYDAERLGAKGEMDWNQHDRWACVFGQLSDILEKAKVEAWKLAVEVEDWAHGEECDASNCGEDGECACPWKPELLVDGEMPEDHDYYNPTDKNHEQACTCGIAKIRDGLDLILTMTGFNREASSPT